MRILICASEYFPLGAGIANMVYNTVKQFREIGIECVVCSPNGDCDIKIGNSKFIEKFGILGLLYYWHQVHNYLKKNDFDIVWLHNPLFLESTFFQEYFVTIHSTYHCQKRQGIKPKIYYIITANMERYCLNKIKKSIRFTSVSTQIGKELKEIGIDKNRITTILNGVDTGRFRFINHNKRKKLNLEDSPIILYVGRLSWSKFVDTIFRCMPLILYRIKNAKLLVIGDGPQKKELIDLAKKLNIYNSIIMYGTVLNEELPAFYSIADVVVCPYSGLVLFEAMSMGKPIVAFNVEWHSEVIENMENGILVENLNVNKFSAEIINLLSNKELSDKLGKNAREFALNKLDWKIIAQQYLEEFKIDD